MDPRTGDGTGVNGTTFDPPTGTDRTAADPPTTDDGAPVAPPDQAADRSAPRVSVPGQRVRARAPVSPDRLVSPAAADADAREWVFDLIGDGARAVIVDSPPGAGKSTLVRQTALRLIADGQQVPVVVQTNEQADDLAYALAEDLAAHPDLADVTVGRLHSDERPPRPGAPEGVVASSKITELTGCGAIVATAAKWGYVTAYRWSLAVIDEAYQMSSAALVRTAGLFDRLLLVGDPGQLEPFTVADERVVRRMATWPLDTAAGTVRRCHPDTPVVPLPVSWRLPPSAASVVSSCFYATTFDAGTEPGVRRMWFTASPMPDAVGQVLTVAAANGWGMLELPPAFLPHTDPQAAAAVVSVVERLLAAQPVIVDENGERPLEQHQVAVGVVYRDQCAQIRTALNKCGLTGVVVDTANRLQGREFAVTVVWHPLSGRRDATAFHLEAGRLCVLASRHRHCCIVVTRAGVAEQLDAWPAAEPVWLGEDAPRVDGWEAHHRFLEHLQQYAVRA